MPYKDFDETLELNKTKDKIFQVSCSRCLGDTRHKVLQSVEVSGSWTQGDYQYSIEYQIVQCQGCESISFRQNSTNSEDYDHIELPDGTWDNMYYDHIEIYPGRMSGRSRVKGDTFLPHQIKLVYDETHAALSNKLSMLGPIGIRSLIESVCKEKNASGTNLKERIDDLVVKGILTKNSADSLHTLRAIGNESAHEMKPQDEESIALAMDIAENLLQSVFILPETARRKKKNDDLSI